MTERTDRLHLFLESTGCDLTTLQMVAGDASNRKYYRVAQGGVVRIVMDAPPEKGEDVRPFVRIALWLLQAGLSAPEVIEGDEHHGFLLLEDLGDDLFARLLEKDQRQETQMYEAAADVLLRIHAEPPPKLEVYSASVMAEMSSLAVQWYRASALDAPSADVEAEFAAVMQAALAHLDDGSHVLIQRDFHAENLLWLPDRDGAAKVGLLDFQDAMLGHPAYDLVSVLQDARRDVSPELQGTILKYFEAATPFQDGFEQAYRLLGLQRNLRILGVFARLCVRDGKAWYVDYIPRVWEHILANLQALNDPKLTDLISARLPEPTNDVLRMLKAKCP